MTVSVNAVIPMAAPAASSPAASAIGAAAKPRGRDAGFGAMVEDAAGEKPAARPARPQTGKGAQDSRDTRAADKGDQKAAGGQDPAAAGDTSSADADPAGPAGTDPQSAAGEALENAGEATPALEDSAVDVPETPATAASLSDAASPAGGPKASAAEEKPGTATVPNLASHKRAPGGRVQAGSGMGRPPAAGTATAAGDMEGATGRPDSAGQGLAQAGRQPEKQAQEQAQAQGGAGDPAATVAIQLATAQADPSATTPPPGMAAQVALAADPHIAADGIDHKSADGVAAAAKKAVVSKSVDGAPNPSTGASPASVAAGASGKHADFASALRADRSQGAIHVSADGAGGTGDGTPATDGTPARVDGSTLSSPVLSQTFNATAARPAALPYPAGTAAAQTATVSVQEGQFGNDIGVQIARALHKGSDDLLIKLDPRHLGRIDVRLSFDHDGVLRAAISADSSTATDMLRRESTDLNRALADAGVRADAQSLRFDTRAGGQGAGQGNGQPGQNGQGNSRWQGRQAGVDDGFGGGDDPIYRSLRSSGHVDLMA